MLQKPSGIRYLKFLNSLHSRFIFDWYLEIGCRDGRTFAPVQGKTIAVDPNFVTDRNIIGRKPTLLVVQETSDEFFAQGLLRKLKAELSFSFLDGMHLFEFLLRDFMNVEANSAPQGVIAMHDCIPFSFEMTTCDLDNLPAGAWTGDVWKLLVILQEYRPDLKVQVLDAAPTGLVLVHGLNPKSRVLQKNYEKIIEKFTNLDLETFGVERFNALVKLESTSAFIDAGFPCFAGLSTGVPTAGDTAAV